MKYVNRIVDLMKSNYGNYVVQKALKLSKGQLKSTLLSMIINNLNKMGERKLAAKWNSIIMCNMEHSNNVSFNPGNSFENVNYNDNFESGYRQDSNPLFSEYL